MSKTFIGGAICRELKSEAPAAEKILDRVVCTAVEHSSVFKCALKVVMVVELFVTGDREFQTAGAVILNALDWKLILDSKVITTNIIAMLWTNNKWTVSET